MSFGLGIGGEAGDDGTHVGNPVGKHQHHRAVGSQLQAERERPAAVWFRLRAQDTA
jgi:hypothetical protein